MSQQDETLPAVRVRSSPAPFPVKVAVSPDTLEFKLHLNHDNLCDLHITNISQVGLLGLRQIYTFVYIRSDMCR